MRTWHFIRTPKVRASILFYCITLLCAVGFLMSTFGWRLLASGAPLSFHGDEVFGMVYAKAMIDQAWCWFIPELSAPYGLDLRHFPLFPTVDFAILKALSLVIHEPAPLLCGLWLTLMIVSVLVCAFSMRTLGFSYIVSFCTSMLYGFSVWTYYRNTGHFNLHAHLVPALCTFVLVLLDNRYCELPRWRRRVLFVFLAAIGFNFVYWPFFGAYLLLVAAALLAAAPSLRHNMRPVLLGLAVLVAATAVNHSQALLSRDHGTPQPIQLDRKPATSELLGLRMRDMFSPRLNHPLPPLRWIRDKID